MVMRSIYATKEELDYLKSKGIQYAEFFRQAIKAVQDGKWAYKYDSNNSK